MNVIEFAEKVMNLELTSAQKEVLCEIMNQEEGQLYVYLGRRAGKATIRRVWDEFRQFQKIEGKVKT